MQEQEIQEQIRKVEVKYSLLLQDMIKTYDLRRRGFLKPRKTGNGKKPTLQSRIKYLEEQMSITLGIIGFEIKLKELKEERRILEDKLQELMDGEIAYS